MKNKINQIVILNGGDGNRVKSITKKKPKCLIRFNKQSFLMMQINFLKKQGFKNFLILTKKNNFQIKREINKINKKKIKINIYPEKIKLGTGGAIKNALSKLNNCFGVIYGDSWLDIDFKKINHLYSKTKNSCLITAISKKLVNHKPNLLIKKKKILKYSKENFSKNNYIEYGYQIFNKKIFSTINQKVFDLNLVLNNLIKLDDVEVIFIKKRFYEIGSLNGIKQFKKHIEEING